MSKIVCDVCGSAYAETEVQCPICGTAKSEAAKPIVDANAEEKGAKSGKFSRPNTTRSGSGTPRKSGNEKKNEEGAPSNLAMIIIVAVLLLAIVSVCVFIFARLANQPDEPTEPSTSSTQPTEPQVPCTGIQLVGNANNTLTFTDLTQTAQLHVKALPENTTDTVTFTYTSSDPAVAQVSNTGLVTPIANGTATITIVGGAYSIDVTVTCQIPDPIVSMKLNKSEITFSPDNGWSWTFTVSGVTDKNETVALNVADITWTCDKDTVAYVENGVLTAVGNGTATVTATYGNLSTTCKVIVRNIDVVTDYELGCTWGAKSDITMKEGEKVEIFLLNKGTNETIPGLEWTPSNDFKGGCASFVVTDKGIEVTALKTTDNVSGQYIYIQTVYEGQQYRFIIRIKPAATQE